MKKIAIFEKKVLLLPKIMAMVKVVGGNTNLRNHKQKEKKMVTESSKSYRYDKIADTIVERIHALADEYRENVEDNDQVAYEQACKKFIDATRTAYGETELFWVFEIILEDSFDYEPSARNPYAVRKPKQGIEGQHLIDPYKLILENQF